MLAARVRTLPSEGGANAALIKLIAKTLGDPASRVTLQSGATSRLKILAVACDGEALAAAFQALPPAARR